MWPLTKYRIILISNRFQIDFSPDLPTARFPGNYRLFSGHRMSILLPSPLTVVNIMFRNRGWWAPVHAGSEYILYRYTDYNFDPY